MSKEIIVNGLKKTVDSDEMSYTDIIELAIDNPLTDKYSVMFKRVEGIETTGGILGYGDALKISDGMILDVAWLRNA
jgi:hypothetical protein